MFGMVCAGVFYILYFNWLNKIRECKVAIVVVCGDAYINDWNGMEWDGRLLPLRENDFSKQQSLSHHHLYI